MSKEAEKYHIDALQNINIPKEAIQGIVQLYNERGTYNLMQSFSDQQLKESVEAIADELKSQIKGFADMGEMTVNTEIELLTTINNLLNK